MRKLILLAFVTGLLLLGCVTGGDHLSDLNSLQSDQIVLAGRIVLDPPLDAEEQDLAFTAAHMKNRVYFMMGDDLMRPEDLNMKNLDSLFSSKLGEPFFIPIECSENIFFSVPFIQMILSAERDDRLYLPGGIGFEIPENARAVSIGTLVYHRDVYNEITEVELMFGDSRIQTGFKALNPGSTELHELEPLSEPKE